MVLLLENLFLLFQETLFLSVVELSFKILHLVFSVRERVSQWREQQSFVVISISFFLVSDVGEPKLFEIDVAFWLVTLCLATVMLVQVHRANGHVEPHSGVVTHVPKRHLFKALKCLEKFATLEQG